MCNHSIGPLEGSDAILKVKAQVNQIAKRPTAVLLTGETGVGKTLIAKEIHKRSSRKEKPFLTLNCAATAENLIESELFGHIKGAFTGAYDDRVGFFEKANGGTLFIDEIGKLSLAMQMKFLRALEEGEITPMGSTKTKEVDVRVIAATNRDLEALVKKEEFMLDLYFRLNVFPIHIPPLRERRDEIPDKLVPHFIEKIHDKFKAENKLLPPQDRESIAEKIKPNQDALDYLKSKTHDWQGNIRELRNEIERAMVRAKDAGKLTRMDFRESETLFDTLLSKPGVTRDDINNAYIEASPKGKATGPIDPDGLERTLSAFLLGKDLEKREDLARMKPEEREKNEYVSVDVIDYFVEICSKLLLGETYKTAKFIQKARETVQDVEQKNADKSSQKEGANAPLD